MTYQYKSEVTKTSIKSSKAPAGRPKYNARNVEESVFAGIRWAAHYGQPCYVTPTAYGWALVETVNKIPRSQQRFVVKATYSQGTYEAEVDFQMPEWA